MRALERYSVTRRLLAATLSLVLMITSLIWPLAHAGHHRDDRDHTHHALLLAPHVAQVDVDGPHGGTSPSADHASCCGLLCHGGFLVLAGYTLPRRVDQMAIVPVPRDDRRHGSVQSSLDRPPRRAALA